MYGKDLQTVASIWFDDGDEKSDTLININKNNAQMRNILQVTR